MTDNEKNVLENETEIQEAVVETAMVSPEELSELKIEQTAPPLAEGEGLLTFSGIIMAVAALASVAFGGWGLVVRMAEYPPPQTNEFAMFGVAAAACVFGIILGIIGFLRRKAHSSAGLLTVLGVLYVFVLPFLLYENLQAYNAGVGLVLLALNFAAPLILIAGALKNSASGKTLLLMTGLATAIIMPILAVAVFGFVFRNVLSPLLLYIAEGNLAYYAAPPMLFWWILCGARAAVSGFGIFVGITAARSCGKTEKGFFITKIGVAHIVLELILLLALGQFSLTIGGLGLGMFMLFVMMVPFVFAILLVVAAAKNSGTVENFFRVVESTTTCVACETEYDAGMKSCPFCAHR